MSGAVTLQDESGTTFQMPFDYGVKFSIDENGHPLSETWSDRPEGAPIPPPRL